jgi:hypothetical protein
MTRVSDSPLSEPKPGLPRIRNPRTQARLRRDAIWQIGLPIGLALAAGITLGVLVSIPGGAATRSAWADVSLMLLIVPIAMVGLILFALIAGLIFAAYYGLRELPFVFRIVQDYAALAAGHVKIGASKASGVVLSVRSFTTGVGRAAKGVRQFFGLGG